MHNYDLSPLFRQWIGFDELANNIQNDHQSINYPPYNIEKSDDNHYRITLALAGFNQQELSVELEGQRLTIRGKPAVLNKEIRYLHHGLIHKEFTLSFTLAEHMTVEQAEFTHGLLNIYLERHIPESLQPKNIAISTTNHQQSILQEQSTNI